MLEFIDAAMPFVKVVIILLAIATIIVSIGAIKELRKGTYKKFAIDKDENEDID